MGEGENAEDMHELRRTADLSFRTTKESARAIWWSMAAMVAAERHLLLTLSEMKDRDRVFLMDALLATSGLHLFQRFLPRCSLAQGAAGRKNPPPRTSFSHRDAQKESVATRATPRRDRGGKRSWSRASKPKPDMWTVLQAKRSSTEKP